MCWDQAFYGMSTSHYPKMNLNSPCPDLTAEWPRTTCGDYAWSRRSCPSSSWGRRELLPPNLSVVRPSKNDSCPPAHIRSATWSRLWNREPPHAADVKDTEKPCTFCSTVHLCHQSHTSLLSFVISVPRPAAPANYGYLETIHVIPNC